MKKHFITVIAVFLITFAAEAQIFLSGALSGTLIDTMYIVIDDISVEEGDSLIIQSGAELYFNSNCEIDINGYLYASGSETDSIKFVNSPGGNWYGIDFNDSADDNSLLEYCLITGSSSSGIYCWQSSTSITNCTISGNTASGHGGGIYCRQSSPSIDNCTINCNTATAGFYNYGGGLYIYDSSSPVISNCTISGNSASDHGGGLYIWDNSSPTITNCIISGNTAYDLGGGLCISYYSSPAISNCAVSGNTAYDYGGGISCHNYSSPAINNCTISGNTAEQHGGGIYSSSSSSPAITNCTISGNTAEGNGGGIYCYSSSSQAIINCTISSNTAEGNGGCIYCSYDSSLDIINTIVEGNFGYYGLFFELSSGSNSSINYSDFYNNENSNFYNPPQWVGQIFTVNANGDSCDIFMNIFADPLFVNPAGGDFHLQAGSPCIDAGDPDSPPDPDGSIADMGAFPYDSSWVSVDEPKICQIPAETSLHHPYPNPFNPSTVISFELKDAGEVSLIVYDIQGREVQTLVTGHLSLGYHEVVFDGTDLSSGIYFVRLTVDSRQSTVKKMVLMK
ncbi:right-handed parallel beta-helix repeat-containing protein [bacterium]|nr:right-handed parallel beta-helix repeat-containing protein [bacterium]